jgi:hypothetical protein
MTRVIRVIVAVLTMVVPLLGLVSCDIDKLTTRPDTAAVPPQDDQRLPLVKGQGPPLEEPPDSIKVKGERIWRESRQASPMLVSGGASSYTILSQARSWLGVPYRYGGNSRSGIDCSHLVYQVYRGAGISSYPYLTTSQMRSSLGFACVNWNNEGGDVVLFRNLAHTGIYMGGGWMIDANSYYGKVTYDNLNSSYWQSMGPYPVRWMW